MPVLTRAHLHEPVFGITASGQYVSVPGAVVTVYNADGVTLFAQTMYSTLSGAVVLANPLTADTTGVIDAYTPGAQTVVLKTTAAGYTFADVMAKFEAYDGGP